MTPKTLKITLAASLALNLLMIGGGVATMRCQHKMRHMHRRMEITRMHQMKEFGGCPGMRRGRPNGRFDDRREIDGGQDRPDRPIHPRMPKGRTEKENLRNHPNRMEMYGGKTPLRESRMNRRTKINPEAKRIHEDMMADRAKLDAVLKMEPFNEAEVKKTIGEFEQKHQAVYEKRKERMIKEAKTMKPEERISIFFPGRPPERR